MPIRAGTLVSAATTNTVPSTAATSQSTGGRPLRPWAPTLNRPMPSGRPRIAPGSAGMTCAMTSPARTCCGVAPSASVTAEARLASRTVAKAAKIAVSAARATSEIVMAVSTCSARGTSGLTSPDVPRAEQVLTAITISLVALAALTAIFAALATVLDARRASAVTLALGATPQQVRAGLVMAQVIPALPGAILGLPLGIGLFKVGAHGLSGLPPVLWLVAAVLGTVFVVAALTSVPARIGIRRPVAEMLQT